MRICERRCLPAYFQELWTFLTIKWFKFAVKMTIILSSDMMPLPGNCDFFEPMLTYQERICWFRCAIPDIWGSLKKHFDAPS